MSMVLAPEVSYVSANPNPTQVNGNTLQWLGMPAVGTFDLTNFVVRAVVPANTPLGTVLSHTITVAQDSAEVTQTNNAYTFTRTVTGSYDPNDKLVSEVFCVQRSYQYPRTFEAGKHPSIHIFADR